MIDSVAKKSEPGNSDHLINSKAINAEKSW